MTEASIKHGLMPSLVVAVLSCAGPVSARTDGEFLNARGDVSNSNFPNDIDRDGAICARDLAGRLVGRFGLAGKLARELGTTNADACRNEDDLHMAEIGNWRVQRLALHPA